MKEKKESRKAFLKRFGFKLFEESNSSEQEVEIVTLTQEQADFLNAYTTWVEEFHLYIKKRSVDPLNSSNNKRLMELSAEAEERKPILEKHMEDELFATAFNYITSEVSKDI